MTKEKHASVHTHLSQRFSMYIGSNCTGISVAVTELIDLQWITEGLLFAKEVVAGPDIYNNFGHSPVGNTT